MRDKALYDDARQLATIHRKNVVERRENPRLEGNAYPEVLFSRLSEALEVTLPAIDAQDAVKAVVSVKVAPPFLPPLPWWPLPLLLIVSFLLLLLVRGSLPLRVGLLVAGTGVCVLFSLQEAEKLEIVAIETRFPALAGMLGAFDPASMADLRGIDVHLDGGGKNLVPSRDFLACRPRTEFETEPLAMQLARKGTATLVSGKVACDLSGRAYAGKLAAHRRRITFLLGATLLVALALFTAFHRGLTARLWAGFQAHSLAYAYITPAMVGMLLLVFMPFSFGILLGFFKKIYNEYTFVGLSNFAAILFDFDLANPQNFYFTLGVTVLWTVVNVGLHVTIGLALALLLKEKLLRFRGVYRVLLIVPWAVPNYITALIWKGMFHKQFGSINYVLGL
ncbi:MAG: sugar ABC transporter permease, partial [Deltaproteobacteria bacterium]